MNAKIQTWRIFSKAQDLFSVVTTLGRRPSDGRIRANCAHAIDYAAQGDAFRDVRQWPEAAEAYWRALNQEPQITQIWVQYGHALKEIGLLDEAEKAYITASSKGPHLSDPLLHLGHVLKLKGNFDEARQAYLRASALQPDDPDVTRELATPEEYYAIVAADRARDRRDWRSARTFYQAALQVNPEMPEIWIQLGHTCKELGDFEAARQSYMKGLTNGPRDAAVWLHLGHAQKLRKDRNGAILAYARAFMCSGSAGDAFAELEHLVGYDPNDRDAAIQAAYTEAVGNGDYIADGVRPNIRRIFSRVSRSSVDPLGLWRRHVKLMRSAMAATQPGKAPIIWLPNIDWRYRSQRPQHLASALAETGHRIFYVSPTFERREAIDERFHRFVSEPARDTFELRLRTSTVDMVDLHHGFHPNEAKLIADAIIQSFGRIHVQNATILVQHPNWQPVLAFLSYSFCVYDYLDDFTAFPAANACVKHNHERMIEQCDLIITASSELQAELSARKTCMLIRNGVTPEMFSISDVPPGRAIIGYFGAIAEWFEMEWIIYCAKARPEWTFVLVGRVCCLDPSEAAALPNVHFVGEVPHKQLPTLLQTFSVGIIPFKINRLTQVTDPVKLYEYLAGGCPVVTSPLPEVLTINAPGVTTAGTAPEFEAAIERSLASDSESGRRERKLWAANHNWAHRAEVLERALPTRIEGTG